MISDINTTATAVNNNPAFVNREPASSSSTINTTGTEQQRETRSATAIELSSSTNRAQAILSYELSLELNIVFENYGASTNAPPPISTTQSESTADNILNSVKSATYSVSDEQRQELLVQTRVGVENGVSEARAVLQSQGILTSQVNSEIAATQQSVHTGINQLDDDIRSELAPMQTAFVATSSKIQDTGSIEIQTNDGDTIRINFEQTQSSSLAAYANSETQTYGFINTQQNSVSYGFSIEGNLDHDERKALTQLVNGIDKLADKFFSGELNEAFEKISDLNFDSNELSNLTVNLNRTESYVAIAAYQSVRSISEPPANDDTAQEPANVPTPSAPNSVHPQQQHPAPDVVPATQTPVVTAAPSPIPTSTSSATPSVVGTAVTTSSSISAQITAAPPTNSPPAARPPSIDSLSALEYIIGEVRQLIEDLNKIDIFSQPEKIAIDVFESISLSKFQNDHISGVAVNQFNQLVKSLSDDTDHDDERGISDSDDIDLDEDEDDHGIESDSDSPNQQLI